MFGFLFVKKISLIQNHQKTHKQKILVKNWVVKAKKPLYCSRDCPNAKAVPSSKVASNVTSSSSSTPANDEKTSTNIGQELNKPATKKSWWARLFNSSNDNESNNDKLIRTSIKNNNDNNNVTHRAQDVLTTRKSSSAKHYDFNVPMVGESAGRTSRTAINRTIR